MELYKIVLLSLIGVCAGFLNTVGGGGSIITVSAMIILGMPSVVANGTNRIALLFQNASAVYNFKRHGYFDLKMNLLYTIPAVIGSILGSTIAVGIPDKVFNKVLAVVMILILLQVLLQPEKKLKLSDGEMDKKHKVIGAVVFFFIGLYAGIIQAGVGFIIIAALSFITNYSLVRINSVKVFIIGISTIFSISVFIINGKVDYALGICIGIGNMIGAYLGSNFAVLKGEKWVRIILAVTITAMVVRLLVTSI